MRRSEVCVRRWKRIGSCIRILCGSQRLLPAAGSLTLCARSISQRLFPEFMKTLTEYVKFHTKTHRAYVHITPQVEEIVSRSGVKEGMVLVSAMHITAGIYVNDNESG